jgi:hypothetical protein
MPLRMVVRSTDFKLRAAAAPAADSGSSSSVPLVSPQQ